MSKVWIRPAWTTDRPAVEAICAQIWEGEDYVPQVWDEWLADHYGQLVVAELESRVVGLAKLSRLADDEWWLHGLRVDPAYRRRGVAGRLQAHLVEKARQIGRGTVRYGTHSLNEPVHRIGARIGFRHVVTYLRCHADPLPVADVPSLRPLTEADLPEAWALVSGSPRRRAARGLYEASWKWESLTRERLAHHLTTDDGWGVDDSGELAGLALALWTREDMLSVGYVDGSGEALTIILRVLRGLAAQQGCFQLRFKPVEEPALVAATETAGYERDLDRDIWIFELQLD